MNYKVIYQFRWLSIIWLLGLIYISNLILIKLPFIDISFQKHAFSEGLLYFIQTFIPKFSYEFQIYNIQTIIIWITGIILGPRVGFITICFYLILGFMGLPIFAGGGGTDYYKEPTFGYLISFPLLAFLSGFFYQKEQKIFAAFIPIISTHLIGIFYLLFFKQSWFDISWHLSFSMISYDLIFCLLLLPFIPLFAFFLQELFIQEVPAFEKKLSQN